MFDPSLVLSGVSVRCGDNVLAYADRIGLTLSLAHPFSLRLVFEGGQKLGVSEISGQADVWQMAGAPVVVTVPIYKVISFGGAGIPFHSDFIKLSATKGLFAEHPLLARSVSGKMVFNPVAQADKRIAGLNVMAQQLNIEPGHHILTDVSLAVTIPGPVSERRLSLQRLLCVRKNTTDSALSSSEKRAVPQAGGVTPDIFVPQFEAEWQGLHLTWAAKLYVLEDEGLEGESWLTLTHFQPFLERLQHESALSEQQKVVLGKISSLFSGHEKTPSHAVTFFVPVRHGEIVVAGYSAHSLLSAMHSAAGLWQGSWSGRSEPGQAR